ncbi:MAG: hypothetical protein AAGA54_12020 [Myxococcota bacterium]
MVPRSTVILLAFATACAASTADNAPVEAPAAAAATTSSETFTPEQLPSTVEANVPVLPWGLTSFGSITHEGTLYVLGGYSGMPHAYSAKDQHGELLAYDLKTQQWSVVSKVPALQGAGLVSHASGLIRVGGMRAMNPTTETPSKLVSIDTVQRFDPAAGTWTDMPSLPEGRSSHDAVVVGDTLYVVGGWRLKNEAKGGDWPAEMFALDLSDPAATWQRKPAPFSRRAIAAAAAGGKVYVLGGMGADRELSKRVEVYDPATDSWSQAEDYPGQGFGMAAVGTADAVLASGADGAVLRLDVAKGTWTRSSTLALPRFFHRMVADPDGTVWALGGIRPSADASRIRVAEPVSGERAAQPVHVRVASPMKSKNRQGSAVLGDGVYFFGGNNSLGQHDFEANNFTSGGFRLDLATLEWKAVADYPVARQTMSVATRMDEIVAFGGFGHDGEGAKSHPEAYVYSAEDDTWSPAKGLPAPRGRTQFGLAKAKDQWWVFGGLDYDPSRSKGDQFRHETAILSAPIELNEGFKPSGSTLSEPRRAFAGAAYTDQYVVVGGMREGFQLVDTCEAFAFESKSWVPFPCPTKPRLSGHLVPVGDGLALVAGSSKGADGKFKADKTIEVFDAESASWAVLPVELPVEPKHLHVFGWDASILAVSLHNDEAKADIVMLRPDALSR